MRNAVLLPARRIPPSLPLSTPISAAKMLAVTRRVKAVSQWAGLKNGDARRKKNSVASTLLILAKLLLRRTPSPSSWKSPRLSGGGGLFKMRNSQLYSDYIQVAVQPRVNRHVTDPPIETDS